MMRLKAEKFFFPRWWICNENWALFFLFTCFILHYLCLCLFDFLVDSLQQSLFFLIYKMNNKYLPNIQTETPKPQCILCVWYPFLHFFSLWYWIVRSSLIPIVLDYRRYYFLLAAFFPWRLCGKLREFYNRISICCISDSVFGATIFHPRIDKLFPGEVWISPFLSLSLSFPDVSLQLPWLTANSFITGHKHQVLHLKGHPTPNSRTSEKSTCKNSIQGTPFH